MQLGRLGAAWPPVISSPLDTDSRHQAHLGSLRGMGDQ